jgi:hypothetical protein
MMRHASVHWGLVKGVNVLNNPKSVNSVDAGRPYPLSPSQTSRTQPFSSHRIRTSIRITEAVLLAGVIGGVLVTTVQANDNTDKLASQGLSNKKNDALNVQVSHSSSSSTNPAQSVNQSSTVADGSSDTGGTPHSVSSDISSTDNNGTTSTQVIVNGQPVSVPSSGNTDQTINTAGGVVSVSTSASQSSQGSSTNSSSSSVNLNISN